MLKLTVLYGHPKSAEAFEKYYAATHRPLVASMKGVARAEFTKFVGAPAGGPPAFYRMAEIYFSDQAQMDRTLGSPEGKATLDDVPKFATGGVTVVVGSVDA